MDRRDCYRILRLQPDATRAQIQEAYEKQVQKFHLSDYDDEPEYIAIKIQELNQAYGQLMGGSPKALISQGKAVLGRLSKTDHGKDEFDSCEREDWAEREKRTERRENHSEEGETSVQTEGRRKSMPKLGNSDKQNLADAWNNLKKQVGNLGAGSSKSSGKQLRTKDIVSIVAAILFIVIGILPASCSILNSIDGISFEDQLLEHQARAEAIYQNADKFDYESHLADNGEVVETEIQWDIKEIPQEELWDYNWDILWDLGLDYAAEIFEVVIGEQEEYYMPDEYEATEIIVTLMDAPAFKEVAGKIDLYNSQPILNYRDYMVFLRSVAEDQVDDILVE